MSEQSTSARSIRQSGPGNPFWKGGRVVASNGYVLVMVGKDHHLADVRGYAYEHRLVAEEKIGRRLLDGEQVHHKDENKQNNDPSNLEVKASVAEHLAAHRKDGSNLRLPGQPNEIVPCACGCGESFRRFDSAGRPRDYISGHNPAKSPSRDAVLAAVQDGLQTTSEIAAATGLSPKVTGVILSRLAKNGIIVRTSHGVYGVPGSTVRANPTIFCGCGCGATFPQFDETWRERRYVPGHNARRPR